VGAATAAVATSTTPKSILRPGIATSLV
jgi:hypothetical protein